MGEPRQIAYLLQRQVDKKKWDDTVDRSPNGFIYSQSFYLDSLCHWDALVMGDYEYIMPLPIRKKAGFKYVYTPRFAAQLGITGKAPVHEEILIAFINAVPDKISYVDLLMNEGNQPAPDSHLSFTAKINFTLSLQEDYDTIYSSFTKDAKKNLRQAAAMQLTAIENIDTVTVIDIYRKAYGALNDITEKNYDNFNLLMYKAIQSGRGFTMGVRNMEGELLAGAFFAIDNKRIYYLLGAPTADGRKSNVIYFLIDHIIKKYCCQQLIFDFEGSDIISVAAFYKKFGPRAVMYPHLIMNKLPFFLRGLKK